MTSYEVAKLAHTVWPARALSTVVPIGMPRGGLTGRSLVKL
jgi:hypothetical protein